MRVVVKDNIPVYSKPIRLSTGEQMEVDIQVQEWLERGIIRPSHSENASPVVVA